MAILASSSYTITNLIDGKDGKTPVVHTAYANSADGKTDFSTTDSKGRRYKGDYSDTNLADSTDPTKYKWVDMVGSVKVGGVNLIKNTAMTSGAFRYNHVNKAGEGGLKIGAIFGLTEAIVQPNQYTLTLRARGVSDKSIILYQISPLGNSTIDFINKADLTEDFKTFSITFTPEKANLTDLWIYTYYSFTAYSSWFEIEPKSLKLEKGNISTDWSLAPEDVDAKIDTKADSELTQEQLNLLLETQNLMTAEMRTKATAEEADSLMSTVNKILADQAIAGKNTESALIENAQRIEAFKKDYDDKMLQLDFVNNYLRATDLGLEISASDGSSSLLIQKDRISMFSAGKEVMYISQGLIHIDNGVFTKTLQIGNFRESQLDGDPTTNVTIYVG